MFVLFFLSIITAEAASEKSKMCWAHYCPWGFHLVNGYDNAWNDPVFRLQPYNDRSLFGQYSQSDEGQADSLKKHIHTAMEYGVDGFCVDVILAVARSYTAAMSRFYRDAEGSRFKIALCIDGAGVPTDEFTDQLADFIRTYGKHPNNTFIDNKPVIFVYNPDGKTPEEWKAILSKLHKQKLDAYYLVKAMWETSLWDNPKTLDNWLDVFNGFYDFGANGFTHAELNKRCENAMNSIRRKKPKAIFCAGIAPGYIGRANGFYRPYLNTATLRGNWEAAIKSGAHWVCLTTWNDYNEHTQFEPSVVNRDTMLGINREYLAMWRGTQVTPRPAQVIISYHSETVIGDDITIEALSFPYTTKQGDLKLRLIGEDQKVFKEFPPIKLNPTKIIARTLRLTDSDQVKQRLLRVQTNLGQVNEKGELVWRELYPIMRRHNRVESVATTHIPLYDLANVTIRLYQETAGNVPIARAVIETWNTAGRFELLRNGLPIAEQEIHHKGQPVYVVDIPLPSESRSREDVYVVRYSNSSDSVSYSNPMIIRAPNYNTASNQPVIVSGGDFDENWPIWSQPQTRFRPYLREENINESEIYAATWRCDQGQGEQLMSTSGWNVVALFGGNHANSCSVVNEWKPVWQKTGGIDGSERYALHFDGDDNLLLPSRSFPYGPFTLEFMIKPEKKDNATTLFRDNGIELTLDAELRPAIKRLKNTQLIGNKKLQYDQ
jgi:hypothetical protein